MNKRSILWFVPTLIYVAFFSWYTNLSGPLTPIEIESYLAVMLTSDTPPSRIEQMRKFMEEDTGRQFFMINVIDQADHPVPPKGAKSGSTAEELMNHYMEHMYPALFKRASHPMYFGIAVSNALDRVGLDEKAAHWELGAVFRYRSRRDLLAIAMNPAFGERHDYKLAALDKTLAYPTESIINLGDPRMFLFFVVAFATALLDIFIFGRQARLTSPS
jgi:hypothetical protein